jgi:flagellar motor protein MotB
MTRFQAGRIVAVLAPLFLVVACSTEPSPTQTLNLRMQARLAPEIADGKVVVQPVPGGTQVAITEDSLFPVGGTQLDTRGQRVLTYFIQALLEPSILQIGVAGAPDTLQGARAQAVSQYLRDHSLGTELVPTDASAAVPVGPIGTPLPPGTVITVNIVSG